MTAQSGLCQTRSEPRRPVFPQLGPIATGAFIALLVAKIRGPEIDPHITHSSMEDYLHLGHSRRVCYWRKNSRTNKLTLGDKPRRPVFSQLGPIATGCVYSSFGSENPRPRNRPSHHTFFDGGLSSFGTFKKGMLLAKEL